MHDLDYREYSLKDCFKEGTFKAILNYLTEEGLTTFGDYLDSAEKLDLIVIEGVGVTKIGKFEERVKGIKDGTYNPLQLSETKSTYGTKGYVRFTDDAVKLFNVNKVFRKIPITLLRRKYVERLNDIGVINLTDFNKLTPNTLYEVIKEIAFMGNKSIDKLINNIKHFEKDFEVYANEEFEKFKETSSNYTVIRSRIDGKTLEEIGLELGLTRERVRQKQANAFNDLAILMYALSEYLADLGILGKYVRTSITDLYGTLQNKEILDIFVFFIKNNNLEKLTYSKNLDLILYDRVLDATEDIIAYKFKTYGKMFNLPLQLDAIKNDLEVLGLEFLEEYDIRKFLKNTGYRAYNDYFNYGKLYYEGMASFIVREYYKNGFNIEQDYKDIYNLIEKEFGVSAFSENDSIHKLRGYFYESEDMILYTDKKKIHINNVKVSEDMLLRVKLKIADMLRDAKRLALNIDSLYDELLTLVPNFSKHFPNRYVLYGVSKYYLSNDFTFKRYYISLRPVKEHQDALVYNLIKSEGKPVSLDNIEQHLGLTPFRVNMMMMTTDLLIYCGNRRYIDCLENYTNYKPQLDLVYAYIVSTLDKYGYCNLYMIYKNNSELLRSIRIYDTDTLWNILKIMYGDDFYVSRKPHVLRKSMENKKIDYNLIFDLVPRNKIHSRVETNKFLKEELCIIDCTRHKLIEFYARYYREYMKKVVGISE